MKRYIVKNDLEFVRRLRGLNRSELAKKSKVRIEAIEEIENGIREPSLVTAILLANALECQVEDLFKIEKAKR